MEIGRCEVVLIPKALTKFFHFNKNNVLKILENTKNKTRYIRQNEHFTKKE